MLHGAAPVAQRIERGRPKAEVGGSIPSGGALTLWGGNYERLQILTVSELLAAKKPNVPKFLPVYQKAAKIAAAAGEQQEMFGAG
jgi:hypothetical protein